MEDTAKNSEFTEVIESTVDYFCFKYDIPVADAWDYLETLATSKLTVTTD